MKSETFFAHFVSPTVFFFHFGWKAFRFFRSLSSRLTNFYELCRHVFHTNTTHTCIHCYYIERKAVLVFMKSGNRIAFNRRLWECFRIVSFIYFDTKRYFFQMLSNCFSYVEKARPFRILEKSKDKKRKKRRKEQQSATSVQSRERLETSMFLFIISLLFSSYTHMKSITSRAAEPPPPSGNHIHISNKPLRVWQQYTPTERTFGKEQRFYRPDRSSSAMCRK